MKNGVFFAITASVLIFSCTRDVQFPEKKSERINGAPVTLIQPLFQNQLDNPDSLSLTGTNNRLKQLKNFISKYETHEADFSLTAMETLWEAEKDKVQAAGFETISDWIEITGFLLEITGKPIYASTLQYIAETGNRGISAAQAETITQLLKPFIFTKSVDHIFVNLFVESSVEYVHSLGGKVKITQEITGPNRLLLKFNTTEKLYVELNILIPLNAENPSVIEKNVKYVANPGEYCLVARKWKEGDFVEIKY